MMRWLLLVLLCIGSAHAQPVSSGIAQFNGTGTNTTFKGITDFNGNGHDTLVEWLASGNTFELQIQSNVAGYNVLHAQNNDPGGYSAYTIGGCDNSEHGAFVFGNPTTPLQWRDWTSIEASFVTFPNTVGITTLNGSVLSGATSITLTDASNFLDPATLPAGCRSYLIGVDFNSATYELMRVTAKSGNTLTVTPGVAGTTAAAHASGVSVASNPAAGFQIVQTGANVFIGTTPTFQSVQRLVIPPSGQFVAAPWNYTHTNSLYASVTDTVLGRFGIGVTAPAYALDVGVDAGGVSGEMRARIAPTAAIGNTTAIYEAIGTGNNTGADFAGRAVLGYESLNSGQIVANYPLGQVELCGAIGTLTSYDETALRCAASIFGVAEGTFTNASTMASGLSFRTGSTGNLPAGLGPFGTEAAHIWASQNVTVGTYSSDPAAGSILSVNGTAYAATSFLSPTFSVGANAGTVTSPGTINCTVFSNACELHVAGGGGQDLRIDSNTQITGTKTLWAIGGSIWGDGGFLSRGTANVTLSTFTGTANTVVLQGAGLSFAPSQAAGAVAGGNVTLTAQQGGASGNQNGGTITLTAGPKSGSGTNGNIKMVNLPTTCTGQPTNSIASVAGVLNLCP